MHGSRQAAEVGSILGSGYHKEKVRKLRKNWMDTIHQDLKATELTLEDE